MIKFNCEKCGQKLSVPGDRAGKKGKCPKCRNIIVVPEAQSTHPVIKQSDSEVPAVDTDSFFDNQILLKAIEKDQIQDEMFGLSALP